MHAAGSDAGGEDGCGSGGDAAATGAHAVHAPSADGGGDARRQMEAQELQLQQQQRDQLHLEQLLESLRRFAAPTADSQRAEQLLAALEQHLQRQRQQQLQQQLHQQQQHQQQQLATTLALAQDLYAPPSMGVPGMGLPAAYSFNMRAASRATSSMQNVPTHVVVPMHVAVQHLPPHLAQQLLLQQHQHLVQQQLQEEHGQLARQQLHFQQQQQQQHVQQRQQRLEPHERPRHYMDGQQHRQLQQRRQRPLLWPQHATPSLLREMDPAPTASAGESGRPEPPARAAQKSASRLRGSGSRLQGARGDRERFVAMDMTEDRCDGAVGGADGEYVDGDGDGARDGVDDDGLRVNGYDDGDDDDGEGEKTRLGHAQRSLEPAGSSVTMLLPSSLPRPPNTRFVVISEPGATSSSGTLRLLTAQWTYTLQRGYAVLGRSMRSPRPEHVAVSSEMNVSREHVQLNYDADEACWFLTVLARAGVTYNRRFCAHGSPPVRIDHRARLQLMPSCVVWILLPKPG